MERFILQVISTFVSHNREFIYKPRGFDSVGEMNYEIVSNWNNTVQDDDDVYVLGDIMLNDNVEGISLLSCLSGKIHIVRGNHDTDTRVDLYKTCLNVVEVVDALYLKYNHHHFYCTHFPCMTGNLEEESLKQCTINLCGHKHTTDPFVDWSLGPIFHVEMDCHNCTPVLIDDIITEMYAKV